MGCSFAIDTGGTFTDVVLRRDDGTLTVDKTLTTHHDLLEGFFRGVALALAKAGARAEDVDGVVVHATVDNVAGEVTIDFAGSSDASPIGINVVMNYTHAYATFAVRSTLNPEQPNNFGSLAPIRVRAPEGSIVNAQYSSPLNARHVVGMFVPMSILKALHQVVPDRVLAEGSGAVWTVQVQGRRANGEAFTSSMFNYSGGMGARAGKPGPSATCYPTGVAAVPVEILEAVMPIVFDRRELRPGSAGAGRAAGGDGQIVEFHLKTEAPWLLNAVPSRLDRGPEGLDGGADGAAGRFLVNGEAVSQVAKMTMRPGDRVLLETPGGGGYGKAAGA